MPSVHLAVAALAFLAWRQARPTTILTVRVALVSLASAAYPVAMTLAVVCLGGHFILDAVIGWVAAVLGWHVACFPVSRGRAEMSGPTDPGAARHVGDPDGCRRHGR